VTDETANTFTLHYHSHRAGLAPFVVGLLKGLAARFNVNVEIAYTRVEDEAPHDSFLIRWEPIS
jgi:hypothetical protein